MTAIIDHFSFSTFDQEVIFAPNSLNQLGDALDRLGLGRTLLCTNRSLQNKGYVEVVKSNLGDCLAAVFAEVHPHVQDVQLEQVLALAGSVQADAIIGMGGGSPIGMAKAAASQASSLVGDIHPKVIAIPTTYSGSEMTAMFGITHTRESPPRKMTTLDLRILPRLVLYDPVLTLDLPAELTGSSGINALAHCLEAMYSITKNPVSYAAAISGVHRISRSLLDCSMNGSNLYARTEMLQGAYLAGTSIAHTKMGLHHGLCHVLGGSAGVPHGMANAILLPHAIRFNAATVTAELLPAAKAMGVSINSLNGVGAIEALADRISQLVHDLRLPQRLRDVGVKEADLPALARLGYENRTVQSNPRPIQDADQIEQVLREAW